MLSEEIVINVQNVSKRYEIYNAPRDRLKQLVIPPLYSTANLLIDAVGIPKVHQPPCYFREFWALKDITFQVKRGETFGIIGRNGSGKSTLLQILAGTLNQSNGDVSVNGRIAALLELGSGFNPEFTGKENVFLNGQILGLTQNEIEMRYDEIVEFADIGEFIDQPVKTYSSGMFVRLAFAVQAHIDASIVIIDEALAVGDVFFRQKCYARLEKLRNSGAAILLVSHSMTDIEQFCARAILLDHGKSVFMGSATQASKHYYLLHQQEGRVNEIKEQLSDYEQIINVVDRPKSNAWLSLIDKAQVNNGMGQCINIAICNADGDPCNTFRQGDRALFFYEFELNEAIGVPICGIVIRNDKGIIVHGKNSWQFESEVPACLAPRSKVLCQQEISLDLAPGDYVFEIGLAAVSINTWRNRSHISQQELEVEAVRICSIADAGFFSIGHAIKNQKSVLTHHGVSDLSGAITIAVNDTVSS